LKTGQAKFAGPDGRDQAMVSFQNRLGHSTGDDHEDNRHESII